MAQVGSCAQRALCEGEERAARCAVHSLKTTKIHVDREQLLCTLMRTGFADTRKQAVARFVAGGFTGPVREFGAVTAVLIGNAPAVTSHVWLEPLGFLC